MDLKLHEYHQCSFNDTEKDVTNGTTGNKTEYNQYNVYDVIKINETRELCYPLSPILSHHTGSNLSHYNNHLSVEGETVELINVDHTSISTDELVFTNKPGNDSTVQSQDRTGYIDFTCWNEIEITDAEIVPSAEPDNIVSVLDARRMTVDENINTSNVHCLDINDCCRFDNIIGVLRQDKGLYKSACIANETIECSFAVNRINAEDTSNGLEAASCRKDSYSNDISTGFHSKELLKQGKIKPTDIEPGITSDARENMSSIVSLKEGCCEVEKRVLKHARSSEPVEDTCGPRNDCTLENLTAYREREEVPKVYKQGQTFAGSNGHFYMYNLRTDGNWELIKLAIPYPHKSLSKPAGGKAIKRLNPKNTAESIIVYKKPKYPEKMMVELKEDRFVRQNTLYQMQDGVFGDNPHVVRVLKDGTVLDVSQWYQCYMPMKTCSLKTKQKSNVKLKKANQSNVLSANTKLKKNKTFASNALKKRS